jgi:TonB family protein
MKTCKRFLIFIATCGIAPAQSSFHAAVDAEPTLAKAAQVVWSAVFTKCDDSLFFASQVGPKLRLREYKGPFNYAVKADRLNRADELNGIEVRGVASFDAGASRWIDNTYRPQWNKFGGGPIDGHPVLSTLSVMETNLHLWMERTSGHWEISGEDVDAAIQNKMSCAAAQSANPFQKPGEAPEEPRIRLGSREMKLIKRVEPVYPNLAREAKIQGIVRFTAIISKDGKVQNVTLVSGHPILVEAAKKAVLQWEYQPTVVNGVPNGVVTTIEVEFALKP